MDLRNDKRQNIQRELDFSSTGSGEALVAGGKETESLMATHGNESLAGTEAVLVQASRTAVYGPVRTVVWQGSAGNRRPYADCGGLTPPFQRRLIASLRN